MKTVKRQKPEREIQNDILEWLTAQGIFCWRNNSTGLFDASSGTFRRKGKYQRLGISDILGVIHGTLFAIEVKTAKGKLSDYQKQFLDDVSLNGGVAIVARSIEDVENKLLTTIFYEGNTTKIKE